MRIAIAVIGLLVLGACTPLTMPQAATAEAISAVGTGKTLSDHVISLVSGKNCRGVRVKQGLTYCEEDELIPKPDIYCYRTLARVTCYDRPDPYKGRYRIVGDNEHNMAKKP